MEFFHFRSQVNNVILGDRRFIQGLEIFFHRFDSLQVGRNLLVPVRWASLKDGSNQPLWQLLAVPQHLLEGWLKLVYIHPPNGMPRKTTLEKILRGTRRCYA